MKRKSENETTALRRIRCAVYTRKSTEENLEVEFNSLDAQREAAEAYISSQRHEGWVILPTKYDDGGFSGSNMERPGVQRLLEDVESGRIDCVVVYKVDRLSRSLLDFARIVEIFDRRGVSFVSVTQQFNTTNSMGRLTLNILLSFAQFEREIIGERIRDKIAATKRKGKYVGGPAILGYDVDREARKLLVNEKEAQLVRDIFSRFITLKSTTRLAKELNFQGHLTKAWLTKQGQLRPGKPWHTGHLYRLLNNPLYIGEVTHKGNHYPGEHAAIISQALWDQAHAILQIHHTTRMAATRTKTPGLLRGLITCGHCGCSMGVTYSQRHGKQYRYYLCVKTAKRGAAICPVRRLAAGEIEALVLEQLCALLGKRKTLIESFQDANKAARQRSLALSKKLATNRRENHALRETIAQLAMSETDAPDLNARLVELQEKLFASETQSACLEQEIAQLQEMLVDAHAVAAAAEALAERWEVLPDSEHERMLRLLVDVVEVWPDEVQLRLRPEGLAKLIKEMNITNGKANV